jgi:hypothetical protein
MLPSPRAKKNGPRDFLGDFMRTKPLFEPFSELRGHLGMASLGTLGLFLVSRIDFGA